MLKKALFGFFYPGYQAENHTDTRQPFLSDTECNTNLSGRGLRKWEVLDVVSGAGYQHTGSDSSCCSIFRSPEEQRSQSVGLLPPRSVLGELGLARGIRSLFLQCQPRAANGGTWELCSYVRAGSDCLHDAEGAGELWVAEGATSESSVLP